MKSPKLVIRIPHKVVILKRKSNFANRIAELVLQAVSDNKLRHKTIQRFMLCNDSVTIAVEVPVYMDEMDVEHMQQELKFKIPLKLDFEFFPLHVVYKLRNRAKKEDSAQMKFESLIDPDAAEEGVFNV